MKNRHGENLQNNNGYTGLACFLLISGPSPGAVARKHGEGGTLRLSRTGNARAKS